MSDEIFVDPYYLAAAPDIPASLLRGCQQCVKNGGLTVYQFLKQLSEVELKDTLAEVYRAREDNTLLITMCLFCVLLANSEGLVVEVNTPINSFVSTLGLLLQAESLARQGLVTMDPRLVSMEKFDNKLLTLTPAGEQRGLRIQTKTLPRGG